MSNLIVGKRCRYEADAQKLANLKKKRALLAKKVKTLKSTTDARKIQQRLRRKLKNDAENPDIAEQFKRQHVGRPRLEKF